MNVIRTILSALYIITMVLLPYGHMFMHAEDSTEAPCQSGCAGHPSPEPESPPEPDSHADCSLCKLLLLPVEIPALFSFHEQTVDLKPLCEKPADFIGICIDATYEARAPPFAVV